MQRPAGVSVVAAGFGLAAIYLCAVGWITLASTEIEPNRTAMLLLLALLRAGPYVLVLAGAGAALIGWGLWRMNNWARRAAMLVAAIGVLMLVPGVSSRALGWTFAISGVGMIARVIVVWYLWREDVALAFLRETRNPAR
jgi:hypothetical protein